MNLKSIITKLKRVKLITNPHFWWDLRYKMKCKFNSPQKWLKRIIPNDYASYQDLLRDINFEFLINFIEDQNGLRQFDFDSDSEMKEKRRKIVEAYRIVTKDLPFENGIYDAMVKEAYKDLYKDGKFSIKNLMKEQKSESGEIEYVMDLDDVKLQERNAQSKKIRDLEQKALNLIVEVRDVFAIYPQY